MSIRSTTVALATVFIGLSAVQAAAQMSLYQDCNYGGGGITIGAARVDMHQVGSIGLLNDDISSMIVDEGYAILYYEDAGFGGQERLIFGPEEVPCFSATGTNDTMSSSIVEVVPVELN
jgi:hypothetical protein